MKPFASRHEDREAELGRAVSDYWKNRCATTRHTATDAVEQVCEAGQSDPVDSPYGEARTNRANGVRASSAPDVTGSSTVNRSSAFSLIGRRIA